jgi:hypothetical protein
MNTKLASRFTAVAIATTAVFGIAASSASAATLTCNAANKGRVVKTKVCSFEKGRYAWLNVVPTAAATSAADSAPIKGVSFSPVDGSFTATILPTWKIATKEPTFVIAYSRDILTPAGFSSTSPSFEVATFDDSPRSFDVETEMNKDADELANSGLRTVLARDVITVKGRKVARYVWIQDNDPQTSNMGVLIVSRDGHKVIKLQGSYIKGTANSARHKAEIEQMIAGMIVQ